MVFLDIENLSKSYNTGNSTFKALDRVSFKLERGEIAVILGPSGSGKSTLVNIIGGIDTADEGKVIVEGKDITQYKDNQLIEYRRENIGFVFQFYNLIPNLTVYENIEVSANICSDPMKIETILDAVGMKGMQNRFPRELSGGQQQRVSIARAIVKKPKILMCDEPTGALDYKTSKEILRLISDVNRHFNTTVLIITHNQAIANMAHKIIRLRSGEIVEDRDNVSLIPAERIEW